MLRMHLVSNNVICNFLRSYSCLSAGCRTYSELEESSHFACKDFAFLLFAPFDRIFSFRVFRILWYYQIRSLRRLLLAEDVKVFGIIIEKDSVIIR